MGTTGWLAVFDAVAGVVLLLSAGRQRRNKAAVLGVAAMLLGVSGWLAVLAWDKPQPPAPPRAPELTGQTA